MARRARSTCRRSGRPGSRKAPPSAVQGSFERWFRASASRKAASQLEPRPRTQNRSGRWYSSPTRQRACFHWSAIETAPRSPQRRRASATAASSSITGWSTTSTCERRLDAASTESTDPRLSGTVIRVSLRSKVKNALDEARILVLGTQVLLGFQYRAFFEPAFERLPPLNQQLELTGLLLLLASMGLVLAPAARHRLVERGEDTPALHRFTMNAVGLALVPFAVVLGLDMYQAAWTQGPRLAVVLGLATLAVAVAFWFGIVFVFG